jgi:hypothetical protein
MTTTLETKLKSMHFASSLKPLATLCGLNSTKADGASIKATTDTAKVKCKVCLKLAREQQKQAKPSAPKSKKERTPKPADATTATPPKPKRDGSGGKPPIKLGAAEQELFDAWKAGKTIAELKASSGKSRSQIRKILTTCCGGKDAFKALRATGSGGVVVPISERRPKRVRTEKGETVVSAIDDTSVLTLDKAARKDGGWTSASEPGPLGFVCILIGPDGTRYVSATKAEKADVILDNDFETSGLRNTRWKLETQASATRTAKKEEKLIEKGEQAIKRARAKKRDAKKGRKPKAHATA